LNEAGGVKQPLVSLNKAIQYHAAFRYMEKKDQPRFGSKQLNLKARSERPEIPIKIKKRKDSTSVISY
jgi:hypothetical protein